MVRKYKQIKTFQNNERKFFPQVGGECIRMQNSFEDVGIERHKRKVEWIIN